MKRSAFFCLPGLLLALSSSPQAVASDQLTTAALSAGSSRGLAVRSDGTIWAWGTNRIGELGLGTNSLVLSPKRIASLSNVVAISAAPLHSLAVLSNGQIWAWGTNGNGRLGNGTFNNTSNPVPVSIITNGVSVAAGVSHSLAALSNGYAMAWGDNSGGQLGTGNTVATNQPVFVNTLTNVVAVAAGSNYSLALTAAGEVWAWGTNNVGQLGIGNNNSQSSPTKITVLSNIVQVAAGHSHALARDQDGRIYSWGRNSEGQLGNGGTGNLNTPTLVTNFGPAGIFGPAKWIAANFNSTAAVSSAGRLFYWGFYANGTATGSVTSPTELGVNSGRVYATVTYGDSFLLAGQPDGSVWAWGFNYYGNWGNGFFYSSFDTWRYEKVNTEFSFSASPTSFTTKFNRGDRYWYDAYESFVLPLDLEKGVRLDSEGSDLYSYGATTPWFLKVKKTTRQHARNLIGGTTNLNRFNVDNPIVAFGSEGGGSPLFTQQPYTVGAFGGAFDEKTGQTNMVRILVYDRAAFTSGATNVQPTNVFNITLPRRFISSDSNAWSNFVTNGNRLVVETNGLRTVVEFADALSTPTDSYDSWGLAWQFGGPQTNVVLGGYRMTHTATSTNYCYVVEILGSVEVGANVMAPMAITNVNGWAYLPMYSLDFEAFPEWRARFVDNPSFWGIPLPPTYAGRRLVELNGMTAAATNNVWLTNNAAYTNLDSTPELRRHPILDQFVEDMGRNPLALASYVINEIEFTDPIALGQTSLTVADSVEVGGVNRSALSVFLAGEGSPTEQCALLVYLLRQAGYSAGYVFPTNSNLRLLDTRLSQLWQINVKGVVNYAGIPLVTNSLIVVNYPWVVANIGTNTVHIFPWLKDTEIVEGLDIYDFLPTNSPTAYHWVRDFAFAKPELMSLAEPNAPVSTFWKRYLVNVLNTNQLQSNLSLDDFGVRAFNRRNSYSTWGNLPKPNFLTNQTQVAVFPSLSDGAATYLALTNIFDRVRVEVFKDNTNSTNRIFDTGNWRVCDLHNRKLLLYTNTSTTASLWLSPFRSDLTNNSYFTNFESGLASLNLQAVQTNVASTVSNFAVRLTYVRRDATLASPTLWYPYAGSASNSLDMTCRKRDMNSICMSVGRVTPAMLRIHAEDYWKLEQQRALNPNFTPAITDDAGTGATMLGLGFYNKLWSDDVFNQQLHKVHALAYFSWGIAGFTRLTNNNMQINMNMNWLNVQTLGNARIRQDSGDRGFGSLNNYTTMLQANGASAEHATLNTMFKDEYPVSSIRLLQLAADRSRSNGWAMPIELNVKNYIGAGNNTYTGYGGTQLKNQDTLLWQRVTNLFTSAWDASFVHALITPGQVTNVSGDFQGMSTLHFGKWQTGAIMSDNRILLNGGWSSELYWIGTPSFPSYQLSYDLQYSPTIGYSFVYNNFSVPQPRYVYSYYEVMTFTATSGVAKIEFTPQQLSQASLVAASLNLQGSTTANTIKTAKDKGWFGPPWAGVKQRGVFVLDPVEVASGDFYADSVDLALAGPLPLQLRRNYLSRNLADNQFGFGWKLGFTPWLVAVTNSSGYRLLYAAEPDGAVLAYRFQSNNVWTVSAEDNPTLANFTPAGIGSIANSFNARIEQNPTNSALYTLLSPDGSKRFFQEMTSFGLNSGTNYLNRVRPYLTRVEDHAGNYHLFTYGTNSSANDFGQLSRAESANGAWLVFKYDFHGRVTEAITDDDRHARYVYDDYGDLVQVTLPDNSTWEYEYQHYTFTTNNQTYRDSNHLLVKERKPDGRELQNDYDSLRRVIVQAATVGTNRVLVTNGWFYYTNNCDSLTNEYITGVTRVEDVFHNPRFYYYTNNLITRLVEPLGRTNTQDWFEASETNKVGYYQRSLEVAVDARGLTNQFSYDSNGNVTNLTLRGDLTGSGAGNDTASTTFTFTNNLPASITDPAGGREAFYYEDPADAYRLTRMEYSNGGVGIATNRFGYTNVTSTSDMGTWVKTNRAFGLRNLAVIADTATNEWVFDGRGFSVQTIRHAKTADNAANSDPPVTNFFSFTSRGEPYERSDAAGRRVSMDFDAMSRPKWGEIVSETGEILAREAFYYNRNGELEWYDGPRFGPEDYVHFDYDGAGRLVEETRWRSRAKTDGTGVEAEDGYSLYATTFHRYDGFGNLVARIDPRGTLTTNSYDALGRLTTEKVFESTGSLLTSEGFAYEAGGLMTFHTNALQGVTERQYTSAGQLKFQKNPDGSTNAWRYNLDGRLFRQFQNNGAYWENTYNDAARKVTRIFYSAGPSALATNVFEFDRRGNLVTSTDASGNSFTNSFDGLGRLKWAAGPSIVHTNPPGLPQLGDPPPPIQQASTNFYDAAGLAVTNLNAIGEKFVVRFDALGRLNRKEIYSAQGNLVRETTVAFSADHHSVTVTNGSGASAILSTTYTDNDGRPVLSIAYPSANVREFTRQTYDSVGNLTFAGHYSATNANTVLWSRATYTYDGLNQLRTTIDRDDAPTTFDYDLAGNLTNRVMPGGLKWRAEYNSAGQLLKTYNLATDGTGTRTNTYTYYAAGNVFAGLPQTHTDGRGVVCTSTYDDYLRPLTNSYSGSSNEHNLTTVWQYDVRGLPTSFTESFASTNTGPTTAVARTYDAYGLLASENVLVNGVIQSSSYPAWDSAGRRSHLYFSGFQYGYGWRADGLLGGVSAGTLSFSSIGGSYSYSTAGLLTNRTVSGLAVNMTSRDGMGRVLAQTASVNGTTRLSETLAWTGDSLLSAHTLVRSGDYTDTRSYDYDLLSRRLATERLKLDATTGWTNLFDYDEGASGGAGVLTKVAEPQAGGASWTASLDEFDRIERETNNVIRRIAYGRMNAVGALATLSVNLDGRALPFNVFGTTGQSDWPTEWRAMMELRPGTHILEAVARHSSGLFTTNKVVTFTNTAVDTTTLSHFAEGQMSYRVWRNSIGQTNRVQTFTWDAKGRLVATTELDANNNGYNWSAVYDALGRRVQTTTIIVTNGVALTAQPKTINSYFDPSAEFLELGVKISGKTTWKIYGPDLDEVHGGMNGTGGLDGLADDFGIFRPIVADTRGNVHGFYDPFQATFNWNASRPTGYGAVPEYRPVALADNGDLAASSAWRGRWSDLSGLYWLGARYYDPIAGRFISADPLDHDADASLYGFCNGDPINFFDADGYEAVRPHWFQAMFPATAAAMGARPMSGSVMGDVRFVHGTAYPAMAPVLAPGIVMSNPRVQGGMKVVGGSVETGVGALGLATTSETGVGAIVSGAAVVHGADTVQSGWRQMTSGNPTPSFTQQGITYLTGSPTVGAIGDTALSLGFTYGAGAYSAPRIAAWHRTMQARYTWGAPPGGHWTQGVGFQMRQELGIVNTDAQLHHWLIPQNQWGKWIPNYIKNQPWNIMVMDSREAHAMVDTAFTVRGVEPYPLPVRLWMGMPGEARALVVGGGLGLGYVGYEAVAGEGTSAGASYNTTLGKKPPH